MSSQPSLPDDPRLASVAEAFELTRWAACLYDDNWRLRWVSPELMKLMGESDERKLGYGQHILTTWTMPSWYEMVADPEFQMTEFVKVIPYILHNTTDAADVALAEFLDGVQRAEAEDENAWFSDLPPEKIEACAAAFYPAEPPPLWIEPFAFKQGDSPPQKAMAVHSRLFDDEGGFIGTLALYASALPATIATLVSRGDEGMFERMAALSRPDRRAAAVMFADLQDSGVLSRRLPSAAYFELICSMTTAIDDVVARHSGIIGKHAGDGVSAFFLAEHGGSHSAAAKNAISAARDVLVAARDAAKAISEDTGLFDPEDCVFNVAVHWGGTLYIGQLVTGGRLEVTALGDEVNECARVQDAARDGVILATKALVERLTDDDADHLGLDRDRILYRTIAELPGASEKAVRDAGSLPVATL